MMLPHTPGRACALGGMFSQRSGLNNITIQASARDRDNEKMGCEIEGHVPEFLRILPPDTFIGIQGKNGDKYAISLGDPDKAHVSDESIESGSHSGAAPDPCAVRERDNVILHSDP